MVGPENLSIAGQVSALGSVHNSRFDCISHLIEIKYTVIQCKISAMLLFSLRLRENITLHFIISAMMKCTVTFLCICVYNLSILYCFINYYHCSCIF